MKKIDDFYVIDSSAEIESYYNNYVLFRDKMNDLPKKITNSDDFHVSEFFAEICNHNKDNILFRKRKKKY